MKITTRQLRRIIAEEVSATLREMRGEPLGFDPGLTIQQVNDKLDELTDAFSTESERSMLSSWQEQLSAPYFIEAIAGDPELEAARLEALERLDDFFGDDAYASPPEDDASPPEDDASPPEGADAELLLGEIRDAIEGLGYSATEVTVKAFLNKVLTAVSESLSFIGPADDVPAEDLEESIEDLEAALKRLGAAARDRGMRLNTFLSLKEEALTALHGVASDMGVDI